MVRRSAVVSRVRGRTDWLLDAGLLTSEALANSVSVAEQSGQPLRQVLDRLGLVSQKNWAQAASRATGLRCIEADDFPEVLAEDERLSSHYLRRHGLALISLDGDQPRIAIADPTDMHVRQALSIIFGREIDYVVATERDIETALTRSEAALATDDIEDPLGLGGTDGAFDTDRLLELANNAPTVRYLDWLFSKAVESNATDIHIEMLESKSRVRLRIDGVLVPTQPVERHLYDGVVSRLKILSGMDISERRLPQDGSIRQKISGRSVDVRVASAPSVHGEVIVLRLLDGTQARARLDQLDLTPDALKRLTAALRQPNGLILMTGPTGSGKTTTLHAGLSELNEVGRKIITIENPVEIQNPGLIQMEVKPELGWTFASALRSVLRHDPDVLMVGEIRDGETAELAVRAAMTGHLVLSTLHTNRAGEAMLRLSDMGVPEYLLSSVLRLVGAQRLIRTLCRQCSRPIDMSTTKPFERLFAAFATAVPELGPPQTWNLRGASGCEACNNSGYAGRRALFEFVDVGHGQTKAARTMGADGIALFAKGETTLKELGGVFGSGKFWV